MFEEAYTILNFTIYLTKIQNFENQKQICIFRPMPPGLGLMKHFTI
jgi:hypothetical protein